MKVEVVTPSLPGPQSTASGRELFAWVEGARSLGHEVEVWSWDGGMLRGRDLSWLPSWCRYEPFDRPQRPMWQEHARSLARPRWGLAEAGWEPRPGFLAWADHPSSFPAVAHLPVSVVEFHYSSLLDSLAARRHIWKPATVQNVRAEMRAARMSTVSVAYSQRVARALLGRPRYVPPAYEVPEEALPLTEEPVAALLADWAWPPNQQAARALLSAWPVVRAAVPSARLLLAGRKPELLEVGSVAGVSVLGEVASSLDVLSQASVLAFPCPPSSGPKIKVLEALAIGLPVVTTPAGVEGLCLAPGDAAVADEAGFAGALAEVLASPERRSAMAAAGRASLATHHSPVVSAHVRLSLVSEALGVPMGRVATPQLVAVNGTSVRA